MCSKTYCFRFILQNKEKTGEIHLLYIHGAKVTVGGNRGSKNEGRGASGRGKGTIRSKKAMENVKIMQEKEERDGRKVRKY